ncbi:MAG: hypothetical protein V2J26_04320 [Pacificimonas sp.]|jgi:hypothetical protein|nr:hypothetical protein [Pacificimonas sp.]
MTIPPAPLDEETAKRRFFTLGFIRLAGIALTVIGVMIWTQGAFGLQDETVGKAVALVGIACMFLLPAFIRRRWREGR